MLFCNCSIKDLIIHFFGIVCVNRPTCKCILVLPDHQCPGSSRTCDKHLEGVPEFTWSIVAAGDQRQERNGKTEKKPGSPQGWEEGKNEGIYIPPRCRGVSFFNKFECIINFLNFAVASVITLFP